MVLEQLDIHRQINNFTLFTNINSQLITDLNVKLKTIKLLEDNIGENPGDLGFGNDFLDTIPKAQSMKDI